MTNTINFKEMSRKQLKKFIKSNELEVSVLQSDTDDDIITKIKMVVKDLPPSPGNSSSEDNDSVEINLDKGNFQEEQQVLEEDGKVTFTSKFPKQHVGHIQFENGVFRTDDKKEITMLEGNRKFGITIIRVD